MPDVDCSRKIEPVVSQIFSITIDYGSPQSDEDRARILNEMAARGRYDFVDPNLDLTGFSLTDTGVVSAEIGLICFKRVMQTEMVVTGLPELGFVVPKIEHCLAFGEQHPDIQRLYQIAFLGSACLVDGETNFPCLFGTEGERNLGLIVGDGDWYERFWFAGMRLT